LNIPIDRSSECAARARRVTWAGRVIWAIAVVSAAALGMASHATANTAQTAGRSSESIPAPQKTYGSKDAPIRLEVFSDFQCPSCRSFYEQTLRPMINDYVAAGKVFIVHRDYPLPMHRYGYESARWANAAARIGKFQDVEAALYDNQDAWAANGDIQKYVAAALSPSEFKRVEKLMEGCEDQPPASITSTQAGGAAQANHGCAEDTYIDQDKALGSQIPVQATPTVVIYYKGKKYSAASGVVSWTILKQFFDQLLTQ
jgi:protein-disulfide isomerase